MDRTKNAELSEIAELAFADVRAARLGRKSNPGNTKSYDKTAEERGELIARLLRPLWGLARQIAGRDADLAEELRAHVLLRCEQGHYDPSEGKFVAWVRTVMTRQYISLVRSRGRAVGGDEPHPERSDSHEPAPPDDIRTAPFSRDDLARIRGWGPLKRVVLLSRSLLWRKVPNELWAADLTELGLPASFPGPAFEDMTLAERNLHLADSLGVPRNTIHVRCKRWEPQLLNLQFVRELAGA